MTVRFEIEVDVAWDTGDDDYESVTVTVKDIAEDQHWSEHGQATGLMHRSEDIKDVVLRLVADAW